MDYYRLSYIDDFGNGSSKYFHCSEKDIKEKALELFNREKELAIKDTEGTEFDAPFSFNEREQSGYVVKEVGFTLAHHIKWEKIFRNTTRKPKQVYLVKDIGHYMVTDQIGEFATLKEAKSAVIEKNKKPSSIVTEDDEGRKLPNGKFIKTEKGYSHSYFFDHKVSYEYDEWDIGASTFVIETLPIEGITSQHTEGETE